MKSKRQFRTDWRSVTFNAVVTGLMLVAIAGCSQTQAYIPVGSTSSSAQGSTANNPPIPPAAQSQAKAQIQQIQQETAAMQATSHKK